jgi:hypothetical protein
MKALAIGETVLLDSLFKVLPRLVVADRTFFHPLAKQQNSALVPLSYDLPVFGFADGTPA